MTYKERYTNKEIQTAINKANSVSAILRNLGLENVTCRHKRAWIKKLLESESIDTSQYEKNQTENNPFVTSNNSPTYVEDVDYFVKGDKRKGGFYIKQRLFRNGWENKCNVCNQPPTHNGKPLVMQVDHLNGDGTDNRLENLQLICPNCHTQTDNFGGRNKGRNKFDK